MFGPAVDDGYGVCYNLKRDQIFAGMTKFKNNSFTSIDKLSASLRRSLLDVGQLLDATAVQKSKL